MLAGFSPLVLKSNHYTWSGHTVHLFNTFPKMGGVHSNQAEAVAATSYSKGRGQTTIAYNIFLSEHGYSPRCVANKIVFHSHVDGALCGVTPPVNMTAW